MRASRTRHGFPPDALFRRRVRRHTVAGDEIPETMAMRLLMVFLPRRRVSSSDVRVHGGGDVSLSPPSTIPDASPKCAYVSLRSLEF